MRKMTSSKAEPSGKRKNVVLSLAFSVVALAMAIIVLVGPGRDLSQLAKRSGVETEIPAAITQQKVGSAAETEPPEPQSVNIDDFGGYPAQGDLLGELKISGTSVDCDIYYGDDHPQLNSGAGIYPGSKIPGKGGTILVAGHTGTYFRDFEHAQIGAQITITTDYGTYLYEITDMRVASDTDSSAYDLDAPQENIILYTCFPFGETSLTNMRYFIYGKFVSGPVLRVNS